MQSKRGSFLEAFANVAIGYFLSLIVQTVVYPEYGFHPGAWGNVTIALMFTGASLLRSWGLRRLFNWPRFRDAWRGIFA